MTVQLLRSRITVLHMTVGSAGKETFMSPLTVSIVAIVMFLVFLFFNMRIGIALLLSGFFGVVVLRGFGPAVSMLVFGSWGQVASFSLAVIPMFILMGFFATYSGITKDLFEACYKWFGGVRGGLGHVTIITSALVNMFCGSATATTATIGTVCYPEMIRYNYKPLPSAGIIASSSAYGLLIPPSIGFIIYCTIASLSVGKQFAAGIVPALIIVVGACITVYIMAKRDPDSMPAGEKFTIREKLKSLKGVIAFSLLVILMLGGIFSGLFSPSEGGAIGAAGAFIIMIFRRKATLKIILKCLKDTAKITGMIFILMVGAEYFGTMLALTRMPTNLATALSGWDAGFMVIWVVIFVYIVLGMAIDTLPLITILTPIFFPLVLAMGWDPLWFGNIMVMCMLLGLISPPDGIPVYIMSQISGQPLMKCFGACIPFFIMLTIVLIVMVYVPGLSTWLPAFVGA